MAQQNINLGTPPAGEDGDTIRTAMAKVQANFSDLYSGALAVTTFKNRLINGGFSVWQRGTSFAQAAQGIYTADRCKLVSIGTTTGVSQQSFTLGQTTVPGEPAYYLRAVVSSVLGASNLAVVQQNIEDVRTCAGRSMVLSFWAKADGNKNIAVEVSQLFGGGGSPSAQVTNIGTTTIALTTSWAKYTIPINVPSIAGKTLGTSGGDYTQITFWLDAGSSYNGRTNSLGQQSGTFDIAQAQFEQGSVATGFELRPQQIELSMCMRYYEKSFDVGTPVAADVNSLSHSGYAFSANNVRHTQLFKVTKRGSPTMAFYRPFSSGSAAGASTNQWAIYTSAWISVTPAVLSANTSGFTAQLSGTISGGTSCLIEGNWSADAEL